MVRVGRVPGAMPLRELADGDEFQYALVETCKASRKRIIVSGMRR